MGAPLWPQKREAHGCSSPIMRTEPRPPPGLGTVTDDGEGCRASVAAMVRVAADVVWFVATPETHTPPSGRRTGSSTWDRIVLQVVALGKPVAAEIGARHRRRTGRLMRARVQQISVTGIAGGRGVKIISSVAKAHYLFSDERELVDPETRDRLAEVVADLVADHSRFAAAA